MGQASSQVGQASSQVGQGLVEAGQTSSQVGQARPKADVLAEKRDCLPRLTKRQCWAFRAFAPTPLHSSPFLPSSLFPLGERHPSYALRTLPQMSPHRELLTPSRPATTGA